MQISYAVCDKGKKNHLSILNFSSSSYLQNGKTKRKNMYTQWQQNISYGTNTSIDCQPKSNKCIKLFTRNVI